MLFYDNDVYKYELYIALKPNIEGFDEEIRLHYYDEKNPDQVMTLYRGNNRAVVDFLNDDNFFSFFPLDEPTDAQNVRYSKHIPTDAEREVLNRFLDEVIICKDSLDRFWFCKDVSGHVVTSIIKFSLFLHFFAFLASQLLNASTGISILVPTRSTGKSGSFVSSYAFGKLIPICVDSS